MSLFGESENPYRAVFDAARDAMIVYTPDGVIVEANAAACSVYGYARDELIGINAREAVHPDARRHFEEFLRVAAGGGEFRCETVDRRRDGKTFPIEVTGTHFSYGGRPHLMSVIRDISERRRAEEQLRRSHDTFYHLIQNNPFGVYVVDADFRLRQVSLGSQKVFATVPRPLLGRDFAEVLRFVWDEPFATEAIARFRHTLETGEPYAAPTTVERRHGIDAVEAYDWRIERTTLPDGRFGVVCYFYDLSERQRWEAALTDARRKLDSALIAGEVGTFEWDVVNDRLWGDQNFADIFNVNLDDSGAAPIAAYVAAIHPDDRREVEERVKASVDTGSDYEAEYRITTGGAPRWVIARGKVERDHEGRVVRFPGVVLDVTERKQAEQLLAAQTRALELLATGAPLPEALGALTRAVEEQAGGQSVASILLVGPDGCSLYTGAAPSLPAEYNAAVDGIKAAKGVGTCADAAARDDVVCTPDLAAAESWRGLSHLPLALGLKAAWSMPIRATDGRVLGTFGTYFRECRGPTERERRVVEGLCRVAALAVERHRAEAAMRESEARFRQQADAMPQMVWVTRPDGYHEYYNRRWYEFTGVPDGSTDGEGWNQMFHPDDQARAWAAWRHSLATGEPYEVEYRLRHHSGAYRWTLGRALPIRNDRGEIERWFGTCTDIDTLKRLTAEREHLLESERAARAEAEAASLAKDKFLAVLSHELRTPLSPVVMTIPAIEIDPELPFKFREDLAMIRRNIDLEVKLIDDLLDLSRVTSGKLRLQMQPVRVHELLRHVVQSSAPETSAKRLRVRQEFLAESDRLSADPARLQQVFWNLLRNAVKFTPEGGEITVRTRNPGRGGRLLVEVADSGVGIPPDVLPRVFDAFEQGELRMTRQFGGLGLGLAIAKAVVEMHGGSIRAASEGRDRGATFTVELDAAGARGAADTAPAAAPAAGGARPRSRVLLVEDHPDTSRAMARLLGALGYEVKVANTAAVALQLAATEPFDVVVSDIGLPDATGYELMEQIRDGYGIRGIAVSGYGMEEDMRKSREAGFAEHVVKPVNVGQLHAVIERVLG